jgi:hypothetical protein
MFRTSSALSVALPEINASELRSNVKVNSSVEV